MGLAGVKARNYRLCQLPTCLKDHHARGYCYHHYWAWYSRGDPASARRKKGRPKNANAKAR
jgi:hypothetical protein